jgi:predicted enzyme related to lactoylglutathione lyase
MAVGRFCWVELHTTNPPAARRFYGDLFGWTFDETPMGDASAGSGSYAIARLNGRRVAGLMAQREQAAKRGAPSNWACYVAVADVAASAAAVVKLGGQIVDGPAPMGPGTFALARDPAGGLFSLWQAPPPADPPLLAAPGALSWNELVSSDVGAARSFYTQLFSWTTEAFGPGGRYTVFKQGDATIGGLTPHPPGPGEDTSHWASYFAVADADATFAKAIALGAQVMIQLTDVPGVGRFGWLQDPQGAAFAIIRNA